MTRDREAIKEVDEMLREEMIQPSKSPWVPPVALVKKNDETAFLRRIPSPRQNDEGKRVPPAGDRRRIGPALQR